MIHHVSIPAREPRHVTEVLAELMGGKCHPFGPLEGAFMATSGDAHGTMIVVYPERATLDIPASDDQVAFGENKAPPNTGPSMCCSRCRWSRTRSSASGRARASAPKSSAAAWRGRSRSFTSSNSGSKTG